MYFMGNNKSLVLAHYHMEEISPEDMVDIMLTPQFYTIKKETLPFRFTYQAKKVAPSLFDGLLKENGEYDYFVYKEEDLWVFIAYDTKEIMDFLASKGITSEKIGKLFFTQQAVEYLSLPVPLDEKKALSVIDQVVVVVPLQVLSETRFVTFGERFRPQRGVLIETGDASSLTHKQTAALATILFLFGIIWLIEGQRYGGKDIHLQTKLDTLRRKYPALQNAYARESIITRYRTIDKQERKKRQIVSKVTGLTFRGVILTHFEINSKTFKATFKVKDKKVIKKLETRISRAGFIKRKSTGSKISIGGNI
ncbi:MAG: hypothetical protein LGB70_06955 [Sulfurovum sp.]|nr:hypothetical protein [Sulfurovum sp.]